jgi:lipoprotein NlpI
MKFADWLLAAAGALALAGPAFAQQSEAPERGAPNYQSDPTNNLTMPRVVPSVQAPPKSTEAEACANSNGKVVAKARIEACSKLIDSGKWKGQDIAWAYSNRCFALTKLGEKDKALADCDKAIELDGKNAVAFQARGMIHQDKGDGDRALADYDKAVELGGNNAALFSDRGNVLLGRGEADKALADYDKAVKLSGNGVSALVERGGAYLAKGQFDAALADYARAIELSPNNAFAHFNRGVAFYVKGDKSRAVEEFRQALKIDPKNAYPGLWLFLAKGGAEGKAELQRYSAKFTQGAWPWPVAQYDLGALDLQSTLAAAKTPGDQCEAQFYIGAERLAKNVRDEGLAFLRKAVEICPKNFIEYIQAAAVLKASGVEIPKPAAPQPKAEPAPVVEPAPAAEPAPASRPSPVIRLNGGEPSGATPKAEPAPAAEPAPTKADAPAAPSVQPAAPSVEPAAPQAPEPAKPEPAKPDEAAQPKPETDFASKPASTNDGKQ